MSIQLTSVGLAAAALLVAALVALISTPVVKALAFRIAVKTCTQHYIIGSL